MKLTYSWFFDSGSLISLFFPENLKNFLIDFSDIPTKAKNAEAQQKEVSTRKITSSQELVKKPPTYVNFHRTLNIDKVALTNVQLYLRTALLSDDNGGYFNTSCSTLHQTPGVSVLGG